VTAKATKRRTPTVRPAQDEAEFRRWTPEEVVERRLLPYRSARMVREKCYRRELFCHRDGGRITFTAEDLRLNNEAGAVQPLSA
jgi:hypothetical protein